MRPKNLAALGAPLLILTALSGCDNVRWGGQEVQLVPPPPAGGAQELTEEAETFANLGLPSGTVLFHVRRVEGEGARVVPVAEVAGDSLRTLRRPAEVSPEAFETRFRQAVLPQGAELSLFRRGAPVGTLQVLEQTAATACGVPTARGVATTVAAAADVDEFIAFRRGLEPRVVGEYSPPQVTGAMNTYVSILAERLVLANGLPRPRSWVGARRDMQPVELSGGGAPELAATYLVGDQLEAGPAEDGGYSIFYLASYETRTGYTPFYTEVHNYREGGKEAPRLVDYLDWNAAGTPEVLVQVYGPEQSWYQVLSGDGGEWRKVWEGSSC